MASAWLPMRARRVAVAGVIVATSFMIIPAAVNADADGDGGRGNNKNAGKFYAAHGWLLWIAFGLMYPIGILTAKYGQSVFQLWYKSHWIVQVLATLVAGVGILMTRFAGEEGEDGDDSAHGTLGFGLSILFLLQLALGFFARPKKGAFLRREWYLSHWLFGTGGLILGWFNIFSGINLYSRRWGTSNGNLKGFSFAFTIQVAFIIFVYLLLERWAHILRQSKSPENKDVELSMQQPKKQEEELKDHVVTV